MAGLVNKYCLFVLQVLKAWTGVPYGKLKEVKTLHHQGNGRFVVDGKTLALKSKMR